MRKVVVKWCLFRHHFPFTHSWLHDYGEGISGNPFPIFHFHWISDGKTKSFQLKFTSCHQPTAYNHHRHSKFKTAVLIRRFFRKKWNFQSILSLRMLFTYFSQFQCNFLQMTSNLEEISRFSRIIIIVRLSGWVEANCSSFCLKEMIVPN